jgi:plastocyanin
MVPLSSRTRQIGIAALAIGLAVAIGSPRPAAADSTVGIQNFAFGPRTIEIAAGETVTWVNSEAVMPHDVTSGSAGGADMAADFASPLLQPGDSFSMTFSAPGEYPYLCKLHPAMTGLVIVD